VASFAVMVGVMNLSGYVAVGRGHAHGDVFTIISVHIVGMYGLILVVGDLIERIGRRRALAGGLAIMCLSNVLLAPLDGIPGISLSLFGLGLGWSLSYVAATTELVSLAAPSERGRLVGFADLLSSLVGPRSRSGAALCTARPGRCRSRSARPGSRPHRHSGSPSGGTRCPRPPRSSPRSDQLHFRAGVRACAVFS
jgi:MFS family permease